MRFTGWEIDPATRVLKRGGKPVEIGSRAFDVLLTLVERQGRVVSKRELLDSAWGDLEVEENNVAVQVSQLRKVLGSGVIATLPALGYMLTAQALEGAAAEEDTVGADGVDGVVLPEVPAPTGSTPPASPLFGRDPDIEELLRRLQTSALVSIVGTGGVGKSSIARVLAAHAGLRAQGEVRWVDLQALRPADALLPWLAKSLGVGLDAYDEDQEVLLNALPRASLCIVLDNCEYVLDKVRSFVVAALQTAPQLRWLLTSQQPLHLPAEVVYRLDPLQLPTTDGTLEEALACGAVQLFCRRAADGDRHFELHAGNLATTVNLCQKLDGLPLAIEMAASRMSMLGLEGVHAQLDQRLRLLSGSRVGPQRHHTLRSTFDWSHELLSSTEQKVFRRLQPFVGGFRIEMAQAVTGQVHLGGTDLDSWQVMEALNALVHKSFLHRDHTGGQRYSLFESARHYAAEHLGRAGETQAVQRRHAQAVAAWFARAQDDMLTMPDDQWALRYVPERANLLAALKWACGSAEAEVLAITVAALAQMDAFVQGQPEIVRMALPLDLLKAAPTRLRALAWVELSWAHYAAGERSVGTDLALRALQDFRVLADVAGEYRTLSQLVRLYESRPGTQEQAQQAWHELLQIDVRRLPLRTRLSAQINTGLQYGSRPDTVRMEELRDLAERSGFHTLGAVCRVRLTDALLIEGQFEQVVHSGQLSLQGREFGPRLKGLLLCNQVLALVQLQRLAQAREVARMALQALPGAAYVVIDIFALAAARQGRLAEAAMLNGHAQRVRSERDESADPAEDLAIRETEQRLTSGLSEGRRQELMQTGAAMATPEALALAFVES